VPVHGAAVRPSEGIGTPGQRPAPDASRLERRAVEPRRDNLDVASSDLHAAWWTLKQTREVLAGALAEAGSVPPEVQ